MQFHLNGFRMGAEISSESIQGSLVVITDATLNFRVVFQQRHCEIKIGKLPSHLLSRREKAALDWWFMKRFSAQTTKSV